MSARKKTQTARVAQQGRATRAQRRAAERERARPVQRPPWWKTPGGISGIVTGLVVAAIVVFAVVKTVGITTRHQQGQGLATPSALSDKPGLYPIGKRAPTFTLHTAGGAAYSLAAQRGHPVVLEFFAVWCPHCQREAAVMQQLAAHFQPKGVKMWMILASPYGPNYDNSYGFDKSLATAADLEWFRTTFHEKLPMLVDPTFKVVNKYGLNGYPSIYMIDKHGVVRYAQSGEQTYTTLSAELQKLVNQK